MFTWLAKIFQDSAKIENKRIATDLNFQVNLARSLTYPNENCGTCLFWLKDQNTGDPQYDMGGGMKNALDTWGKSLPRGYCKRYPPTHIKSRLFRRRHWPFPETNAFMWCGEWRDIETNRASSTGSELIERYSSQVGKS